MRAATQGDVNIRNTHGWMTTAGTAVMHNGVLFDQDSYRFNVDSELIVDWLEKFGTDFTLEMLLTENYANVFLIENLGDYYVSRTSGGSLFTDGRGNFATNQVGRINKPVKHDYQQLFKSGFVKPEIRIQDFLDYEDYHHEHGYYRDGYRSSYDWKTGVTRYEPINLPLSVNSFNDSGKLDGYKPTAETDKLNASVLLDEINESVKLGWDTVHNKDDDYFTDSEYQDLLDAGELSEYERKRKVS